MDSLSSSLLAHSSTSSSSVEPSQVSLNRLAAIFEHVAPSSANSFSIPLSSSIKASVVNADLDENMQRIGLYLNSDRKPASEFTKALNQKKIIEETTRFHEKNLLRVLQGFLAPLPNSGIITDANGKVVWNASNYKIKLMSEKPHEIHPSLFQQTQLLSVTGLFEVTPGVYQVRGADISNMTIIEGKEGLIVIDPLLSTETAKFALDLYYQHRKPKKPIHTVIYSHSHADHFGGVGGIISREDVDGKKVQIIAPEGFLHDALTENVLAGNRMSRVATSMYGTSLPVDEKGHISSGLGPTVSKGTVTLIPPTVIIKDTGEKILVDGIEITFQMVPDSEAPSEMVLRLKIGDLILLLPAEIANFTLHNLNTPRGAQVRNGLAWSKHLNETLHLFGKDADILFAPHHWPIFNNAEIQEHLKIQRDLYKFIHDRTLYYANQGYTPDEIVRMVKLPKELADNPACGEHYGTLAMNIRAVYAFYLGIYDGNPANLNRLSPQEEAQVLIEVAGGVENAFNKAADYVIQGQYREAVFILNHLVFAEPDNHSARFLLGNAYEQLGYQSASGPRRDIYLNGAMELRHGTPTHLPTGSTASPDLISAMPLDIIFDYMGVKMNSEKIANKKIVLNWIFTDISEEHKLSLEHSALTHTPNKLTKKPDAAITLTRATFNQLLLKKTTFKELVVAGEIVIDGSLEKVMELFGMMDEFPFWFNLVTPNPIKIPSRL